jgi:DNA-binding transcriptional LysR family regulator
MDLDLRLVRYFVAVADELHFGRAAAGLFISQPALSKQIRKLEEQLGSALLVRDSRHVTLTPHGQQFLAEARQLLALAERMQRLPDPDTVRIAHIYELDTSRDVAAAFTSAHPEARLVERVLDSARQLRALLANQLDVAILRVTAQMVADHPSGWHHELLRLEPLRLVGRPGGEERPTASLRERPVEVFADGPGSGLYNAHGSYLTGFEQASGVTLRWLGNPGAFSLCLSAVNRAAASAYVLEFDSYAQRYAAVGLPVHDPEELQPLYPWSIAWREEEQSSYTRHLIDVARSTAESRHWREPVSKSSGPRWLPPLDPVRRR